MLPGITIKTTPTSRFPIAQAQMQRWHNGAWQSFGPLLSAKSCVSGGPSGRPRASMNATIQSEIAATAEATANTGSS